MRRHVHFMRHGESEYNVRGLCNDDPAIAVPLTARGREQAAVAARQLGPAAIKRVFVSTLPRALETAAIVNTGGVPVSVDSRLDDRHTGFEGRAVADYLAARDTDPENFRAPGGESFLMLKARVLDFLADLAGCPERQVLVVSHHEVLQVVRGHFLNLDHAATRRIHIDNGEIFSVELPIP
jgi:alpha-ribazole phosphatase